jgi:hypothetical protein
VTALVDFCSSPRASPVGEARRHPRVCFRCLVRLLSRYSPPARSIAQGSHCETASIRSVLRPNRSSATSAIDALWVDHSSAGDTRVRGVSRKSRSRNIHHLAERRVDRRVAAGCRQNCCAQLAAHENDSRSHLNHGLRSLHHICGAFRQSPGLSGVFGIFPVTAACMPAASTLAVSCCAVTNASHRAVQNPVNAFE